jgi:hypothetical protein
VALLNSAAFAAAARTEAELRDEQSTPASAATTGKARKTGEATLLEKCEAQASALRQAGARVVTISPRAGLSDSATLRAALHSLLHQEQTSTSQRKARRETETEDRETEDREAQTATPEITAPEIAAPSR